MHKSITTKSTKETQNFGKKLAQKIAGGGIICLYGDLGAGKTTLVQGIIAGLGIKKRVVSPTFIIMRNYGRVSHVDLYRLDDASNLGLEELWQNPKNIILIEWPEKIENLLPKKRWDIKLRTISKNEHEIIY